MRRITITLGFGLALALSGLSAPARAQFPVFYGGQGLTPFGNRGSDGSYRYPSPRPEANRLPTGESVRQPLLLRSAGKLLYAVSGLDPHEPSPPPRSTRGAMTEPERKHQRNPLSVPRTG